MLELEVEDEPGPANEVQGGGPLPEHHTLSVVVGAEVVQAAHPGLIVVDGPGPLLR